MITDGGLLLDAAPDQEVPAERLAGLERALSALLATASEVPLPLDTAIWTACAEDPALFAEPLPPLGEALEACGLAHGGGVLLSEDERLLAGQWLLVERSVYEVEEVRRGEGLTL